MHDPDPDPDHPGVGHELSRTKVAWLKRDVLLFNVSIGCKADEMHYLYELHDKFAAFPTFPLGLVFKGASQEVKDFYSQLGSVTIPGVPPLDPRALVDGERAIYFLKPLPVTSAGRNFETCEKVLGVFDKGKSGTIVETEITITDTETDETYVRIIGSFFYVGQGGWGGPRGTKPPSNPMPDRDPDGTLEIYVQEESAHLYRLNGDYNPLHATPEPGKKMGFGGIILHGVYAYNRVAHGLLRELGGSNPANMKEFRAKFAGVVKPGDCLQTSFWRMGPSQSGWEEVRFVTRVVNRGGGLCLSEGRTLIRTTSATNRNKL